MRRPASVFGGSILASLALASPLLGQFADRVDPDPDMPVKDGFDTERVILWSHPNFEPLRDPEMKSLDEVRRSGEVEDNTTMVVFESAGRTISLISSQMAYHHVAQGEMAGEPWMVTF